MNIPGAGSPPTLPYYRIDQSWSWSSTCKHVMFKRTISTYMNIDVCYDSSSRWFKYEIINQIMDWPLTMANFYPISLDFFRWLQVIHGWIGMLKPPFFKVTDNYFLRIYLVWAWSMGGNLGADRTTLPQQTRGLIFQLSNNSLNYNTHRLSCHQPINTNSTSAYLQSPEKVQWDWMKICHSLRLSPVFGL